MDRPERSRDLLEARQGPQWDRLAGTEGLRALAAGSILVFHVWMYGSPGGVEDLGAFSRFVIPHLAVGVTLFFTLSGYLLYRPVVGALLGDRALPPVGRYARNRALRVLPAYWMVLIAVGVAIPAALVRLSASEVTLGRLAGEPGMLLANAVLLQNFFAFSRDSGIGPAWSLAVELGFYLALPALGLLAATSFRCARTLWTRVLALLAPVGAMFVIGTTGKAAAAWALSQEAGALEAILARSFFTHADLFAPGMALAVLHVILVRGAWRLPRWWPWIVGTALGADMVAVVVLADRGRLARWGVLNSYQRLTALACLLLVALVVLPQTARGESSLVVRALEWRPLALVGMASYSLFLWHEPVIRYLESSGQTSVGALGFLANLLVTGVLSGILAWATYAFVERPALKCKLSDAGVAAGEAGQGPAVKPLNGSAVA